MRHLNQKGETLVETLVAILIFTMASIVLYTMVSTATAMNTQVKIQSDEVQEQLIVAERTSAGSGTSASMILKIPKPGSTNTIDVSESIKVYRKTDISDSLYTFLKEVTGG